MGEIRSTTFIAKYRYLPAMFGQTTAYIIMLLLLSGSCSLIEKDRVALKRWTSSTKIRCAYANLNSTVEGDKECMHMIRSFNPINLPLLPIIFAQSEHLPDGRCKEDARRFLNELQHGILWAVQMFDASSKYPDGILYGNTRHLGNFDECYNLQVDVRRNDADTDRITGKYCLIDLQYVKKDTSVTSDKSAVLDFDPNESFWEAIKERGNFLRISRYFLQLAMCVPSNCNVKDIETALKKPLKEIAANSNIEIQIAARPNFCQTVEEAPKITVAAKIYCIVLLGLLSLIIVSTWYDGELSSDKGKTSKFQNVILSFSARRNFQSILQINYTHPEFEIMNFIRLFLSVFVVSSHHMFQYGLNPTLNLVYLEKILIAPISVFLSNGPIVTDLFFALGALLLTHRLLKDLDRRKRFSFISNIITRYLRLTPSYAMVIFFYAWIFPLLDSGPFWKREIEEEAAECATNWWTNLLYINNYVKPTKMCLFHSWYLSADFQLFVFSHFVIFAFWSMPRKIGYSFLGTLTIFSCAIPFIATYLYDAMPLLRITPSVREFTHMTYFTSHYIKTHMRSTGYFVGIIAGAILHDHKRITWQMSKFWSHMLVLPLPVALFIAFQLWTHKFFLPDSDLSVLESALYAFCHRLVPALCICTTIVVLSIGNQLECYTSFIKFLTPRWMQTLARLTYGVFLVSDLFHTYHYARARSARMFSFRDLGWEIIPDIFCAFTVSLFIAICVEEPFRKLAKQLFPN